MSIKTLFLKDSGMKFIVLNHITIQNNKMYSDTKLSLTNTGTVKHSLTRQNGGFPWIKCPQKL